jgi:hypothetical protein
VVKELEIGVGSKQEDLTSQKPREECDKRGEVLLRG